MLIHFLQLISTLALIARCSLAYHLLKLLLRQLCLDKPFLQFFLTQFESVRWIYIKPFSICLFFDVGAVFVSGTTALDEEGVRGLADTAVIIGQGLDRLDICDEVYF